MWVTMGPWPSSPASTHPRKRRKSRSGTRTPEHSSRVEGLAIRPPVRRAASRTRSLGGRRSRPRGPTQAVPSVEAISVAGQQHGMVVTDEHGTPVRPAKLLERHRDRAGCRMADQEARQTRVRGPKQSEAFPYPSFTITKLSWLHRTRGRRLGADAPRLPAARLAHMEADRASCDRPWGRVGHRLLVADRGASIATTCSRSSATTSPGRRCSLRSWHRTSPPGVDRRRRTGRRSRAGRATTWPPPWDVGLGPGEIAMSIGTSGTAYVVSDRPDGDSTGAVAGFADATGRFLPLVCTLERDEGHRCHRSVCSVSITIVSIGSLSTRHRVPVA